MAKRALFVKCYKGQRPTTGRWFLLNYSLDTTAFGWWWPGRPSHAYTRHTRLDSPQMQEKAKGRRRENAWSSLHLVKRRSRGRVRENIADDGHCKIRGIRKVHWIITKPNKPNGVRAYSSSLLHVIILFFKIFWNFVHFCPNSQIFFPFSIFLGSFSEKSQLLPFTF